jgi:hypothetical protein
VTSLPFGKFKGQPLSTLTDQYMKWLLAQDFVAPDAKAAVKGEQDRRAGATVQPTHAMPASVSDEIALEIGRAVIALLRAKGVTL